MANRIDGTNATNATENYGYPKFVANDRPSWLMDWNNTMDAIDRDIHTANETADNADTKATEAKGIAQAAESAIGDANSGLTKQVNILKEEVETPTTGLLDRMSNAESDLTQQNQSLINLDGKVDQVESSFSSIQSDFADLQTEVEQYDSRISGLLGIGKSSNKRTVTVPANSTSGVNFSFTSTTTFSVVTAVATGVTTGGITADGVYVANFNNSNDAFNFVVDNLATINIKNYASSQIAVDFYLPVGATLTQQ